MGQPSGRTRNESQRLTLFYTNPEVGESNIISKAIGSRKTPSPHREGVNNTDIDTCLIQEFDSSFIPYSENKPVKPKSWNGDALSISLFGTNEFIEIDLKNISTLLLRMADFITNRALNRQTEKNILAIASLGLHLICL